jgi:diaminopropionate ammonia-lyase
MSQLQHYLNEQRLDNKFNEIQNTLFNKDSFALALKNVEQVQGYFPTPLIALPKSAKKYNVKSLYCKFEGPRFGGNSFKATGVAHAVISVSKQLLARSTDEEISTGDLFLGKYRQYMQSFTFTAATSGNHGYALAWAATSIGAKCIIYSPSDMSQVRQDRISALGAEVIICNGNFDVTVQRCTEESAENGYLVISGIRQDGLEDTPEKIMNGYAIITKEICDQLLNNELTHIFVGGGGGRLAASMCAYFAQIDQLLRPKIIVVEPANSDCLMQSAIAGSPAIVSHLKNSIMTGLVVNTPSLVAWPILQNRVFCYLEITDESACSALIAVHAGLNGDAPIETGETGIAAIAGFLDVTDDPDLCNKLGINSDSTVVLIACEGVTDAAIIDRIKKYRSKTESKVRAL